MLNSVLPSSPLPVRLHFMLALFLPTMCCIYVVGFLVTYVAFLLDRKAAITAVHASIDTDSGVTARVRSLQATSVDHREALLAAAIWPVLLVTLLVGPRELANRSM